MKNTILLTTLISGAVLGLSACGGGGSSTPAFTTFDGKWQADCVEIGTTRSFQQVLTIAGTQATSDIQSFAQSACAGTAQTVQAKTTFAYKGEAFVSAILCTAEKVNANITSISSGGTTFTTSTQIDGIINLLGVNVVPEFNLLCLDANGNLRTGDVSSANDGSTEAKRPTEMDATDTGFTKI